MSRDNGGPKIAIVDWIDSASDHGWHSSTDEIPVVARCQTVGYVVTENKESLTLAQSRCTDNKHWPWGELITIPKCAITKRQAK